MQSFKESYLFLSLFWNGILEAKAFHWPFTASKCSRNASRIHSPLTGAERDSKIIIFLANWPSWQKSHHTEKSFCIFGHWTNLEFKASVGQTRIMESHFYFFTSWGWKIKLEMTKLRRASFENIYQLKLDIRHLLWYRNSEKVFVFAVFPGVSEFKDLQMFPWISIQIHLTIPWYESTAAFG